MLLPISKIIPNPNNPRTIKDESFKKLVQSLKDFPEMLEAREIILNKDHVILGGNMRFKAAQEAGIKELPVKIVDWPEDKQRQFIIKDNVSGGEWDWDVLANEWDTELLDEWGLELPDKWGDDTEVEEDESPEVDEDETKSELGKIYQLGRHRVMCGDSTDKANVELLMNGVKADMVFTDPPYGINLDTDYSGISKNWKGQAPMAASKKHGRVINDDKDYDPSHIFDEFSDVNEVYLWGANYYSKLLPDGGSWIIWDKTAGHSQQVVGNEFEMLWSKQKHRQVIMSVKWSGIMGLQSQDLKSRVHPTQKPLEVHTPIILKRTKEEAIVVDLFLGSGSTLIACEQTERTCYGMELDPKYVDVIRKRYAKFTNNNQLPDNWEELTPCL